MPRRGLSPLTAFLRESLGAAEEADRRGIPADEVAGELAERRITRRTFLRGALAAGAGAALAGPLACTAQQEDRGSRVVVVGAGMAGLHCAYVLRTEYGIPATVYEGADRIGGRTWTLRGFFRDGHIAEHGGEFISSEHRATRDLARRLGLSLEVVHGGGYPDGEEIYLMDGRPYTFAEATADWQGAFRPFREAARAAPYPQTRDRHTEVGARLDRTSVPQWIEEHVEGGTASRLGRLLLTDVLSEYGGEPEQQPALNLIYLLAYNEPGSLAPLTGTDERFHVRGGNDQLADRMADRLGSGSLEPDTALVAVRANGERSLTCTFQSGARTFDVRADRVVVAIPFTLLREVDLSGAGLSARKLRAIRELPMGTIAKLHVQLRRRPWMDRGLSGVAYTDPSGFQVCWDESVSQSPPAGLLVQYAGGAAASSVEPPFGTAPSTEVEAFLGAVERVFPGTASAYEGLAWRDRWAGSPWHRGAYSYWGLGHYTTIAGYEGVPEGSFHFCGEHTSPGFQGYMEGAVRSGRRVAGEVAAALGRRRVGPS